MYIYCCIWFQLLITMMLYVDDGSCTYPAAEPAITGLYIDGIIDDRVNANFDNMNTYDANGSSD